MYSTCGNGMRQKNDNYINRSSSVCTLAGKTCLVDARNTTLVVLKNAFFLLQLYPAKPHFYAIRTFHAANNRCVISNYELWRNT